MHREEALVRDAFQVECIHRRLGRLVRALPLTGCLDLVNRRTLAVCVTHANSPTDMAGARRIGGYNVISHWEERKRPHFYPSCRLITPSLPRRNGLWQRRETAAAATTTTITTYSMPCDLPSSAWYCDRQDDAFACHPARHMVAPTVPL